MVSELIKTKDELTKIADGLAHDIAISNDDIVSRFSQEFYNVVFFWDGKKAVNIGTNCDVNRENMTNGTYSQTSIRDLSPQNIPEVTVARDLEDHRFQLARKDIPLPTDENIIFEDIPSDFTIHDDEFRNFTRNHPGVQIARRFSVAQKVVVNSHGGIAIQSIPYMQINFSYGLDPIPTSRDITVVCNTESDIQNLTRLIKFISDPTPEGRIQRASSFSEAFHELYKISTLKYGGLEEAGIPISELYDVVILTGTPVHEIFGHHFEEPMRFLKFGESGTFKSGQSIQNRELMLSDDPRQVVEGFRVLGFTHFDAYGRVRERRTHIKDGKVHGFLGSEYVDYEKLPQYLNLERSPFVGNATQEFDGFMPQPRMSCTVLDGKVEEVDLEGKLVIVPHKGHTNSVEKSYTVEASECYVIRDGEPKRVIPLQVTGGINQALANIVLLESLSYQTGTCGKPDPIYNKPGSSALVSQFTRNQIWQDQQVYPSPISKVHLKVL